AVDRPVLGADPELPFLEPRAAAGPVHARAADRLARPRREAREVLGNLPRTGGRAVVQPRELAEARPLVVDEVLGLVVRAGLEEHGPHPGAAQVAGHGAAA